VAEAFDRSQELVCGLGPFEGLRVKKPVSAAIERIDPEDHLVRQIDRVLRVLDVQAWLFLLGVFFAGRRSCSSLVRT